MQTRNFNKKRKFKINRNSVLIDVIKIFYEEKIRSIEIIDENNNLIGTVQYLDLFKLLFPDYKSIKQSDDKIFYYNSMTLRDEVFLDKKIKDLINNKSEAFEVDMALQDVLSFMKTNRLTKIPIAEDGKVIGLFMICFKGSNNFLQNKNYSFIQRAC